MPSLFPKIRLTPFRTLNTRDDSYRLDTGQLLTATNVFLNLDGSLERIDGYSDYLLSNLGTAYTHSLVKFERWSGATEYYVMYDGALKYIDPITKSVSNAITGLNAEALLSYAIYGDKLYFGNGIDENKMLVSQTSVIKWGIAKPTAACSGALAAGTNLGIGAYGYVFTYYNSTQGVESPPSPALSITTTGGNQAVNLSSISVSADGQVDKKRIYRTTVGGAIYWRVAEIANATTTYADTTADTGLGVRLPSEDCDNLPNTSLHMYYNGRMLLAGDLAEPQRLYYSEADYPHFYKPATNYYDFDVKVTAFAKVDVGVVVFERERTWLIGGSDINSGVVYQVSDYVGCTNSRGWAYIGKNIAFLGPNGVYMTNFSDYGVQLNDTKNLMQVSELVNDSVLGLNGNSAALGYDPVNHRLYITLGVN